MFKHKYYKDFKVGGADWDDLPEEMLDKLKKVYVLPILQIETYTSHIHISAHSEEDAWDKFNLQNNEGDFDFMFDYVNGKQKITKDTSAEVEFYYDTGMGDA